MGGHAKPLRGLWRGVGSDGEEAPRSLSACLAGREQVVRAVPRGGAVLVCRQTALAPVQPKRGFIKHSFCLRSLICFN